MRILLFLLFPIFLSAQINRAYGVIEIGGFPTSSATGPKFAYRPADSSFYRWSHGSTWVKVIEPSITSDTIFITDQIGTSYVVSGDTINLTPYLLKSDTTAMLVKYIERGDTASMLSNYPSTAGYGIIDAGKTWRADTTSPNGLATRLFAKTLPTTITAGQVAYSNGTNLVGSPNHFWDNSNVRLGIGTNAPSYAVHSVANVNANSVLVAQNSNSGTNALGGVYGINNSGTIGAFGMTSSGYTTISAAGANAGLVYSAGSGGIGIVAQSGPIKFATGALTESMRFTNGGGLLINTTTDVPTSILTARSTTKAVSPFPIQSQAQADAITGVQANFQYETDANGLRWHNGTRKAYALESTFAQGQPRGLFFADANGQVVQNHTRLMWDITNERLGVGTNSPAARFSVASLSGGQNTTMAIQQLSNNASAVLSYTSIDFYVPSSGLIGQFFGTASNYANAGVNLGSNSNGFLNEHNNGMLLLGATGTNGYVSFNTGGYAVANERMRILANGNIGIGTTSAQRLLHVAGAARITGTAGTATDILGRDGNGDLSNLNLSGLGISGGILTAQNFANTNLTATGNRTHDWANYNFTWANMKKFMWGADSLFRITKEYTGYTYAVMRQPNGQALLELEGNNNNNQTSSELRLTDTEIGHKAFINLDNRGLGTDGFRMEHYNLSNFHNILFVDKTSRLFYGNQSAYSSGTMFNADATIANGISSRIVIRGSSIAANTDSVSATHFFRTTNNQSKNKDVFGVYTNGTGGNEDTMYFRIDKLGLGYFYKKLVLHAYGVGTKEASDLSKTQSNYIAAFATDGTVLDLGIGVNLKVSGGTLDVKNKSLIDSLPLGSVTIDANANSLVINNVTDFELSSDGGNGSLLFNDEIFQVEANTSINLSTNGDAVLELTEKAELRGRNLQGYNSFKIDSFGFHSTFVNTLAEPDSAMSMITSHDRGLLKLHKYGKDNHVATVTGEYSERIAGLTPNGLVQDFRLTRDTFIEDVTLFSVGTLLHDCQELTIVSSMTSTAPSNMEIRFPDAAEFIRGRKIIVYSKKKDAGSFIPQIKVVGGVSRLYFTTTPGIGGADPSDQATLSLDDVTWPDIGTYEFTCLKIDNTPSYRWVLKQR